MNAYLRCVDAQEARADAEGIDGMTGYTKATPAEVLWRAEWDPVATANEYSKSYSI